MSNDCKFDCMPGLFPEDKIRNPIADEPWKKSETDKMLDLYLAGCPPTRIAQVLGRNPKAVKRRLEQFGNNERDYAIRYEPFRRISRKGKRMTQNELSWLHYYRERQIPLRYLAKVLQREVREFGLDQEDLSHKVDMKRVATGVDLVLAYRYLYYVQGISILSDQAYDDIEKEEMEFGAGGEILKEKVGSDRVEDYPPHIRALGLYLAFKYGRKDEGNKA